MIQMITVRPTNSSVENISPVLNQNSTSEREGIVGDIYVPLIKMLKVCGLFSVRSADTGKPLKKLHFTYCVLVQVIVFMLLIRFLFVFKNRTGQFYTTIGLIGFLYFYISIVLLSLACFSSNWSHLATFLTAIDDYDKKYGMAFDQQKTRKLHRRLVINISGIIVSGTLISIPFTVLLLNGRSLLFTSIITPFDGHDELISFIVAIIFGSFNLLCNLIVFSSMLFVLCNLRIFKLEFLYIRNKIEETIKENRLENIGQLRLQHEHIVGLVKNGNIMFSRYSGLLYCYALPITCLMLYGTTTRGFDIGDIVVMAAIIAVAVVCLFVFTFMAAYLNKAAHSPVHDLFMADIQYESQKTVNQFQLFVSRLTGSSIGVSVFGLFVIDNSTILMVFGTIISYAIIVIQFSIPLTCDSQNANNTIT